MLHYIIQTIVFQFFFLIVYNLFLKKETFFNYNRIYLVATTILSLVIPFVKIEGFKNIVSQNYFIALPEIILGDNSTEEITNFALQNTNSNETVIWSWSLVIFIGICVATLIFSYKIFKIVSLIYNNKKYKKDKLIIVKLEKSNTAFSFFNYVFLGENIQVKDQETILKHEQIHVKQKHTLDLLFFEVLRILFWFNPLIYIYQNQIASLHEFIADQKASKNNNKQYYENLLEQIFNVKQISLINPFFKQSLIKKRIVMLQKSNSKKSRVIKYALVLPLVIGMLFYTSCSQQEATAELADQEMEQVVEKFRNQLQTENSTLTKAERIEIAEYIINNEFKANIEDNNQTSSRTINGKLVPEEVSFSTIDNVPVFPGCEEVGDNKERKKCMSEKISRFVSEKFNTDLAQNLGLNDGKHRIAVIFKVDKNGNIVDIKSRAPHPRLEEEAVRIVSLMPKMKPGMHNGKAVTVPYGFPISFQVNE